MNRIVAQFIDHRGRSRSILLALLLLYKTHEGVNITRSILKVIKNYQIKAKLGYFILNNASNNDTAIKKLERLLHTKDPFTKFRSSWRRLHCLGHIFNLVARQILFSNDKNIFKAESQIRGEVTKKEEQER